MPETSKHNLGRNDPCHCGSGKKYKQCCLGQDEAEARQARAKAQEAADAAAAAAPAAEHHHEPDRRKHSGNQKPLRRGAGPGAAPRFQAPRKVGAS